MLKVMDYLVKEKISSETLEGVQHVKQITSRRKALRFKRSDDNPELPENFKVGQAIGGGDCFFDSVAQGLKRLKPEMDFTVKSLREVCKKFAQSQLENDQSWLKEILKNENEQINEYIPRIEFTANDIEQKSELVNVLGLNSPIWGRSEIEGRIICKEYNIKLHTVEKHVVEGKEVWLDQIVNSEGSKSVDSIDYNEENTIHIINRGNAHFEPIFNTQEIQHNKQQSPDPSDYDDEITPEEELINIIKSRDSEEEKLTKIGKLFEKELKPDINFQGKDNDTPLHIIVRKKELKVIEWLVKNGAKIDIKNSRGRTSLDIAKRLKRQDIVQILESHIQQVSVEEHPIKQEKPSEENKLEDTDRKNQRSEQERRIPYSDKLPFDKELKLSNGNFKSIIESDIKHVELNTVDKLNFLNRPAYPDEYLLVRFASRVYKEREDGQELPDKKLPEGWKLLTTAYNQGATNHYFGAAYWNPDQQQIVIAHRGTDPSSTGALWTDIRGILQNNYVPQVNSAVTFANKIKTVLNELNKKPNVNLQLSFTGHSLGGWLAQITTFTTKYFTLEPFEESSFFVKSEKVGYHAHTVTFDSPGSKDMLSKIKSDFDLRHYKDDNSLSLSYLDITSYLSAPNLVNTCCLHLGTIYRVFIEDLPSERSSWDFAKYTKETHSIVKIEEALDSEKGNELKTVIDWPLVKKGITKRALEKLLSSSHGILGVLRKVVFNQGESEQLPERNEYEYFHKLAKDVSDYNPGPDDKEGYCTVRYQVQNVDKTQCGTRIFTHPELEFLRDYQKLRQFLTLPQLQGLFSSFNNENMVEEAIKVLKTFKVEDKKKTVHCQSETELNKLIAYVKNALYFFPDVKGKTKNAQTRKPIWFDVKDLVRPFTALTPGRQEKLEQIASSIQEGIVVISGLGGVGKSELAVKYARSQYSQEDSVVWINAETHETAKDSFRRLLKELGLKTKDQDEDKKSVKLMAKEAYEYLSDRKSLFIFDNTKKYTDIEEFLPLGLPKDANKPWILITSDNLRKSEWSNSRVKVEIVELSEFKESESIKFVKESLKISNDLRNEDIKNLANKLYHFPILLECAVRDIERYQEDNRAFNISDYINNFIESFYHGSTSYHDILPKLLKVRVDQIKQEEHGQRALEIAYITAYCASQNLPKGIFFDSDDAISLLLRYSIVKQGSINMHELVQQIIRSELQNQPLEEETLKQALNLFKDHMNEADSVEHYEPHIISVWNYASKHDKLVEEFITNADYSKSDYTTYFHLIVEKSSYEVVSDIFSKISPDKLKQIINVKRQDQKTLLHCAALGDSEQTVRLLVGKGANINALDQLNNTPLHLAAKNGYLEVVKFLLGTEQKGRNVNAETQQKFTPLHLAAKDGHLDVVDVLLNKGANINAQTKQKYTPLHFAAQNGQLEVVNALLDKGAKVENFDVKYKITPLHLAAESDHVDVIKALLNKGKADINAKTPKKTPLMWAAQKGRANAVKILLERNADIAFKNDEGETALNLAAKGDHWEIALVLFNKGAKLDELSSDQYLSFICFHIPEDKFEIEYRKLFSDKNKPIRYDQKKTKFYYKDGKRKIYIDDINLEKRKNLYLDVLSKIEDSIQKGDIDRFQKFAGLIDKIGEIEKKDSHSGVFLPESFYKDNSNSIKDTNLIVLACEHNNSEILEYLFDGQNKILGNLSTDIKKAINPGDTDSKGHNAFYYAICSGNVKLLDILIDKLQGNYFNNPTKLQELDDLLSKAYDELKLKNVPLSEKIEVFVQDKLINLRFFYEKDSSQSTDKNQPTLEVIKKRIDIVINSISSLGQEYSGTKKVDEKFLYSSTFIAKNIRILKRQLPFTYDKLPWEEIEFSLTSFVSSYTKDQEINFVFKTILDKQKLLDYLSVFKDTLSEKKNTLRDEDLDKELPSTQRRNIVDNIICSNPTFSDLYDDYEQMRDIYSLKQIEHYINLVSSDNIEEEIKQHVIERALQVTGEYLKSTLTSPNMSSTLSELIIQSVSESTSKILTSLRNSLSHSYSLASRMKIAESRSPEFLSNVQNDLKKIGEKISDIFYKNKVEAISTLLSKIANSNSLDEMKKIAKVLEDVQFDQINLEKIKIKERENVKRLIGDLNNCIKDKTDYQKELFDKINEILELEESKLINAKVEYLNKLYTLEEVVSMVRSGNIKTMKTLVQRDLKNFLKRDQDKRDQDKQEKIVDLVVRIANSETHNSLVNELVYNIFYTDQFALGRTSLIEEFNEKLTKKRNEGTRRATIEEKQAKLDGIFDKILRKKLNLQEDKVVEIIKEFKGKVRGFSDTKGELLSILDEFIEEESQGEKEIKPKICTRYKEEGYESLIDKSGLEKKEKEMLKGYLTKTKKLYKLIEGQGIRQDIKSVFDKITNQDVKSKVMNIFEDLVIKIKENKEQVKRKTEKKQEKFKSLLDILKLGQDDQALITGDYENNDWDSVRSRIDNLYSEYEEFLGLIDHINQDSINKVSQLFNGFSQLLTLESDQKEKLNESFKEEIEETLKSSSVISQKLSELASILDENELNSRLIEKFSSYKVNRKLQAIVEMLVFDITEVLNAKGLLTENRYFLDKTSSILIGKQLRNYLAHGDPLINALSFDTLMSIISNARTFVEKKDITIGGKKLIGQVIEDDPFSLEEQHKQNLEILNIQKKMFFAAEEGSIDEVKDCIKEGADVNARDINGWDALHYAARGDKINVTKFFLGQNLSIDTKNNKGETPLHIAACFGSKRIISSFVKYKDPDVNHLLCLAAGNGYKEIVDILLSKKGADVNKPTDKGMTPLHLAAQNGHKDVVDALLKVDGIEVNTKTTDEGWTPLHLAAQNGHKDVVDALLEVDGIEVNAKTIDEDVPLHLAAQNGHKGVVDALLKVNGIEINAKNDMHWTPLHLAAQNGHKDVVNALLEVNGIEVNETTDEDVTPLHLAAQNGHKGVVDALLKVNGIEINAKNDMHWTPLHLAAQNGHKDVVDTLLKAKGIEVNAQTTDNTNKGATPLHLAAQNGHKDVVDALLKAKGIKVNARTTDKGITPLHVAAQIGHKDVVDALLKVNGIEVNAKTTDKGMTPLHVAAQSCHKNVVDALLKVNGIEVNAKTTDKGRTPLHLAAQNGHKDVVDTLLKVDGIEINVKTTDENVTPLHLAAQNGHKDVVDSLLKAKGIEVNARTTDIGWTPLHLAAQNGHKDVVNALLKVTDIEVNAKGDTHWTPLHVAAQSGHRDVVDALLKVDGIEINVKTTDENVTPLHLAAQNGREDVVDALLKVIGIEVNAEDENKCTPLHYAAQNGHKNVVDSLLRANGIEVNAKTTDKGWTPLHYAAQNGYKGVVDALLEVDGIEVNAKGTTPLHLTQSGYDWINNLFEVDGIEANIKEEMKMSFLNRVNASTNTDESWTPLHLAVHNGHKEVVEVLLNKNADIFARNDQGTVLHLAVVSNNIELIRFILDIIKEKDPQNFSKHIDAEDAEGDTPLMWMIEGKKVDEMKILLQYGVDLSLQNNDGKTALHYAVSGGNLDIVVLLLGKKPDVNVADEDGWTPLHYTAQDGHLDIVKLLLDHQADPTVQNSDRKTPLDLAQEKSSQNPQVYQEIIKILTESINQQQKTDPINQGGEVSSEECLPGPSSGNRRKREAENECLFTWEDVDEFNTEQGEKRDFDKIMIDGEKFVNYIKDLSEEKRSQLIQLADKVKVTGESQSLVNKLTNNQKVMNHLARVGRISGMTMHGMMAKNVLADFLNGDYQGVAINVGFIAGGQGFAKVAEAASFKGLKLASEGKLLLGRSLRAASPFLARGTSAFVIYDLVNQVKAFKNGTEEALVGVVGDSIYLGVDAAEIGIEIAEAFEVLEGVSSVTGPIGATVGAVVFVGTDVYMAVKRVDKIDEIIHLTGKEKFAEGLRAFIGMQPEEHIQELLQEKQVSNQLVRQGLEYLKQHNDIQSYVFPTGKSVVDSCRKVPYKTSICSSGGLDGGCLNSRTVTRYAEECTTKFEVDLNNTVLLDEKRNNIKWSRARPDDPSNGKLFCLPRGNHERVPSYGSYLCENAIGITDLSAKTGNHTLINLGEGTDHAKGFIDSPNIFVVNNGSKRYFGGNKDDIFILQGSSIKGYFHGEGGVNTLDLTSFAPEEGSIEVKLHIGQVEDYYRNNFFGMSGINKFLGRKAKADQVFITCDSDTSDIKFVDGQSGSEEFVDHINIHDKDCAYEMQVVVRSNTVIYNRALKGDFHYIVPYALGSAKVDFIYTAEALNLNNTFVFEYEPAQIKNVDVRNINVLNKTSHIIAFNFSPMSDKEFNITISGASNPSYRLGNNTEIKVGNKGNLYMLENANKSVDEIIRDYLVVANRLNKMSFFIQSLLSNETVAIGSGNYEVIHNNPLQKSHLVGNGGENVYVIDSERFETPLPEVVIYDLDVESSVDTIDLRNLIQQARGEFSSSFKLQVLKSANDLLLKATVEKSTEDTSISEVRRHEYFTVRLKDGVNWYNKTHVIMDNVPMRISLDSNEWSLKPQPLMFEKDKEVIVVTSQDIEENTELITPKRAGNYTFVRDHGSDLIITNAFNTQDDLCTIVLSKFYETPKMETLSIKFADKEIVLKDKQKEINAARDVDIVKREHKKQVYSDVFNHSPEIMLSDQPHRHEHSRQHIRNRRMVSSSAKPSSWINDLFGWVKSSIGGLLSPGPEEVSNITSPIPQRENILNSTSTTPPSDSTSQKQEGNYFTSGDFFQDNVDYVNANLKQAHEGQIPVKFEPKGGNTILEMGDHYLSQADSNGTIMLLDLLIRKVTGQKYISTVDQSVSPLEAQGYALNIIEEFEEALNETAIKSGISVTNLNFDPVAVQSAIVGQIINGRFSEISKTLYSSAKEACPKFKQTGKFLAHLRSSLEGEKEAVLLQQKVEKPSKILDQQVSRKVELSKKPDTFLNGTSVVKGISSVLEL